MADQRPPASPAARTFARRALLAGGAIAGIGALARRSTPATELLAQEATPQALPAGSTLESPGRFDQSLAGQRITVMLGPNGQGSAWEEVAITLFTTDTGVIVRRVPGPESIVERLALCLQTLNAGASDIDVFMVDTTWVCFLASHALDLSLTFADVVQNYAPAAMASNTVGGILAAIPWNTDGGLLYCRSDLLEKYTLAVPTTWAALESAALTIQDGERAANEEFHGFIWPGAAADGLAGIGLEWIASSGGGTILGADGSVTIDNTLAAAALDRAAEWIGAISPEDTVDLDEAAVRQIWTAGNAAFMRSTYDAHATVGASGTPVSGRYSIAPLPAGEVEGGQTAAALGGWNLLASRYSQSPDAAALLCRYLTTPEIQASAAIERMRLPSVLTAWEQAEMTERRPEIVPLRAVVESGLVPLPSTAAGSAWFDASSVLVAGFHPVLTRELSGTVAVARIGTELQQLLGQNTV
ncbi:MAG: extracellular solute-binding protein [Chloroflexota bacterium]|nr:extracellular solute-binding protein [Chloroflexota bacterium]